MTDKIMIDGVDVSGCENFFANACDIGEGTYENCEGKDCLYKQLKQKEEECEKLKAIAEGLACSNEDFINKIKQLQAEQQKVKELRKANDEKNKFLQALGISATGEFKRIKHYIDKLQEQNKSLQHELRAEKDKVKELKEKSDKYKQALEEIKVYITNSYCLENYSIIETAKLAKQILRKCEVLDD